MIGPAGWRKAGAEVRDFEIGDEVFGISGLAFGAHAEWICIRADGPVALMPTGASYELASALDGATDALAKLRRARVATRQTVLIHGASGSIGTAAVQLVKVGADVTAVCNTESLELVRSLGVDALLDCTATTSLRPDRPMT